MERRSPKNHMVKITVAKSPVARCTTPKSPLPRSPVPRSPVAYEKYKSRCAHGLINFFRFRHRHSKKMISDTCSRSLSRHSADDRPRHLNQHAPDVADEKTMMVDSSKAKVKRINKDVCLEKQMKKKITTDKVETVRSNSEHAHDRSTKNRKAGKTCRRPRRLPIYGCYDVSTAQHANSKLQIVAERSLNSLDSQGTVELHPQSKYEKDCNSKSNFNLQVNLNEASEAFINQKLIDGRHVSNDGSSLESKHFLDALKVLNSNKDLFVKLLQDPNSLLVKHIDDLRDSPEKEKLTEFELLEHQISSSKESSLPKNGNCQAEDIVILKPRLNSFQHCTDTSIPDSPPFQKMQQRSKPVIFPFEQMKRKLMQAIRVRRKKQYPLLNASAMHLKSTNSPDEVASDLAELSTSFMDTKRNTQMHESDPGVRDEAGLACEKGLQSSCLSPSRPPKTKRHDLYVDIAELRNKNLLRNQRTKPLDGMNSAPDYDFLPMVSPGRTKPNGCVSPQRTFSQCETLRIASENHSRNQKGSCSSPRQKNVEASPSAVCEEAPDVLDNLYPDVRQRETSSSSNISCSEMETNIENDSEQTSPYNGVNRSNETVDDYSSSPSSRHTFKEFDIINENTEQPSPISVLDQFFTEDTNSPINTKSQPRWQLQIGSEEVCFATHLTEVATKIDSITSTEEFGSTLNYISRVLQASHFTWDELSRKCQTSDQILDFSLFEDIHVGPTHCFRDHRLLFDYVNQVVLDAYNCYSRRSPWLSFIKPSILPAILTDENIVNEIMKYVDPELLLAQHTETMEKIIEMDLNKSRRWMDIRLDAEDMVCEIIDNLLEELTAEIAVQ